MITIFDVIKRPLITEKATGLKESNNHVAFEVDKRANKHLIKNAVEKLFDVKVKEVKVMNYKGKTKRFGTSIGKRNDWKKAIVVLEKDQKLEFV